MASIRESITESIKYWEPRRIVYNAVLTIIVLIYFFLGLPESKETLNINFLLWIFMLAVLANVAYCAAYLPDLFAQMSGVRDLWFQYRWILFVVGVAFAAVITRFFAMAMFLRLDR